MLDRIVLLNKNWVKLFKSGPFIKACNFFLYEIIEDDIANEEPVQFKKINLNYIQNMLLINLDDDKY